MSCLQPGRIALARMTEQQHVLLEALRKYFLSLPRLTRSTDLLIALLDREDLTLWFKHLHAGGDLLGKLYKGRGDFSMRKALHAIRVRVEPLNAKLKEWSNEEGLEHGCDVSIAPAHDRRGRPGLKLAIDRRGIRPEVVECLRGIYEAVRDLQGVIRNGDLRGSALRTASAIANRIRNGISSLGKIQARLRAPAEEEQGSG